MELERNVAMLSAEEAQRTIQSFVLSSGPEVLPLDRALGRILAFPVKAPVDLPLFDNAAMDGFAVRSEETFDRTSVLFKVIGSVEAGSNVEPPRVRLGQAVRIMTGASVPEGADAVVPFEESVSNGDSLVIDHEVSKGENIRKKGEDVRRGEVVLRHGVLITSRTISLLAALGIAEVSVFRRPRVRIVVTGNELVEIGAPLQRAKIYNSNGPTLVAALREAGVPPESVAVVSDQPDLLTSRIREGLEGEVLLTIGGVSAGDLDLVPKILDEIGAKIHFHKVAIKPGKPLLFGTVGEKLIFGLPGNPVSALIVFERFVRPALLRMMGMDECFPVRKTAIAMEEFKGSSDRETYLRGVVAYKDGRYEAISAGVQGSAQLKTLACSNATLIIPVSRGTIRTGEPVLFEFFKEGA
ncbi:MAG: molybdopterin molybdotransferase MoeA [Deltaproteobacteria bacterium]|nr:molybdopterin molybdotransferase MoeA [Deltaproteobacteria bacterium]